MNLRELSLLFIHDILAKDFIAKDAIQTQNKWRFLNVKSHTTYYKTTLYLWHM